MENKIKQLRPFLPKGYADKVQAYLLSKGTRVSKMSIYGAATGRIQNWDIIEALIACAQEEKRRQSELVQKLEETIG